MSRRSSSDSAAARGVDVIDLDRFMRGVRPDRDRLVVDGGGARRTLASASSSGGSSHSALRQEPRVAHGKRFSHDSGLSDSCAREKRSRHRRVVPSRQVSAGDGPNVRSSVGRESGRSLRAFRVSCERELRDQRHQLARVAALCEQLARRRRPEPTVSPRPAPCAVVSDLSSSSRSTSDATRKDEHRAEECKTYKIIMTKLDELNRAFLARRAASPRARAPPAPAASPPAPPPPPAARSAATSASVAMSDKVVATEYTDKINSVQKTKRSTETHSPRLVERAVGEVLNVRENPRTNNRNERSDEHSMRMTTMRAATPAFVLDNNSRDAGATRCPKVIPQSTVNYELSDEEFVNTCDPRYGFDLDDPVQLYEQVKHLHPRAGEQPPAAGRGGGGRRGAGGVSLCSLCRSYWRSLRLYVAAQLFKDND